MSNSSNVFPERRCLSNVSFSPLSSEVLYVRIRRMSSEEDNPQLTNSSRQPHRKSGAPQSKKRSPPKPAMTNNSETSTNLPQTLQEEQKAPPGERQCEHEPTPCLKHAAENISSKACKVPSEKINLCNDCSKSMLSYIFLVQDFLDSLAKEIIGSESFHCLQCARQEVRNNIVKSDSKEESNVESRFEKHTDHKSGFHSTPPKNPDQKHSGARQKEYSSERRSSDRMFKEKSYHPESPKRDYQENVTTTPQSDVHRQKQSNEFRYTVSSPPNVDSVKEQSENNDSRTIYDQSNSENKATQQAPETYNNANSQWTSASNQYVNQPMSNNQGDWNPSREDSSHEYKPFSQASGNNYTENSMHYQPKYDQPDGIPEFRHLKERVQPNYQSPPPNISDNFGQNDPNSNPFERSPSLYSEHLDGIISTLSTAEREVYDNARDRAGWERFTESQERLVIPSSNTITSEAFVTSCRNNAEAIGCLVLGTSLLLCRTSRTLCVLVSEGVSTAFRSAFSEVFQVVQLVRSLDSLGTTKLALLEQPELGVTFEKLNIWRLLQFTKCVYLNPDTLVIQNCDELFCREELSAVPDIGWPDCFNSGVFVYSPSVHTFWQLLEFAEKQGSYDGGDQGLLNSYFNNSWSSDISRKLSFIYNLMANVSYTYSPAFRQFGRDIKIVQFHGSFKPWHVKFFSKTGQISPSSPVHPTYVQFVHIWINIFRITVLRLLSQEIQSYVASQEVISAVETLRFFPLPTESEAEFFLTPPSVRLRLTETKLNRSAKLVVSEPARRKSAEFFRHKFTDDDSPAVSEVIEKGRNELDVQEETKVEVVGVEEESKAEIVATDESAVKEDTEEASETDEVIKESKVGNKKKVKDDNGLPGSEMGDYQGMKAWEQGRMDYEGNACSDNIIKRLQFLMNPKPK